jgi:hypothetical protein
MFRDFSAGRYIGILANKLRRSLTNFSDLQHWVFNMDAFRFTIFTKIIIGTN